MIGYQVGSSNTIVIYYNLDSLVRAVDILTGDFKKAVEVASWAELATIGDVYEDDDFLVTIVEK